MFLFKFLMHHCWIKVLISSKQNNLTPNFGTVEYTSTCSCGSVVEHCISSTKVVGSTACAYRRTRQSPRKQHGQGGKGTDICSLSFGHSLSPLSYSTSKLTLLHSNAAPAPPPN